MTTVAYPKDWTEEKERAFRVACQGERWVHATNAVDFRGYRATFGWQDDRSPTGFLSGRVVEADHMGLRVRVTDIMAGLVGRALGDQK